MITNRSLDMWQPVYIDGEKRQYTKERGVMFVDSDSMPRVRCRAITLDAGSWRFLEDRHGSVRTSGHVISMLPPRPPVPQGPPRPPRKRASLPTKLWAVIKEHYK